MVVDGTANYSYLVDKLPLANLVEDSVTPYLQKLSALVFEQNNENRRKNAEIEERKSEIQKILSGSTSTQKQ